MVAGLVLAIFANNPAIAVVSVCVGLISFCVAGFSVLGYKERDEINDWDHRY